MSLGSEELFKYNAKTSFSSQYFFPPQLFDMELTFVSFLHAFDKAQQDVDYDEAARYGSCLRNLQEIQRNGAQAAVAHFKRKHPLTRAGNEPPAKRQHLTKQAEISNFGTFDNSHVDTSKIATIIDDRISPKNLQVR